MTPRVSSYYLRWLQEYLRQQGLSVDAAEDGRAFLPVAEWRLRLDEAALRLGDANLGLHLGQTITPARFGVLGYLLHHCDNLGEATLRLHRYLPLFFHFQQLDVEAAGDTLRGSWRADSAVPHYHEEVFAVASAVQFTSALCGQPLRPAAVGFVSAAPENVQELREYFACLIAFEQASTWVEGAASLLAQPTVQADANLRALLERQAEALLAALPMENGDEFLGLVSQCVVALLQEGEPTLERVAGRLNMSARTLHRRLEARGRRFREVLEQTRCQLAQSYLRDARLSLADVAILLGYAEQSPFTHAFKRWTGTTPHQWRRRELGVV